MTKIAGSGSGSISERHAPADPDPDPHQNVMDLEHWNYYQSLSNRKSKENKEAKPIFQDKEVQLFLFPSYIT